jgi:hypothetical protein
VPLSGRLKIVLSSGNFDFNVTLYTVKTFGGTLVELGCSRALTSDANGFGVWQYLPAGANAWSINGVGINNTNLLRNVGIVTTNPQASLHVKDGNVVFSGPNDDTVPYPLSTPISDNSNMGISTVNPVVKLDIAGTNIWDLTNTDGDMIIGNANYRIKMSVSLDGGGSGASRIRAVGRINILYPGARTTDVLSLFSNGNATLIGTLTQASDEMLKKKCKNIISYIK